MTREETIKWLESLKAEIGKSWNRTLWHYAEAIDMAIEALSAEAEEYEDYEHATLVDIKAPLRASAEAVQGEWEVYIDIDGKYGICSVCGKDADFSHYGEAYNFCPNCGARMTKGGDDK